MLRDLMSVAWPTQWLKNGVILVLVLSGARPVWGADPTAGELFSDSQFKATHNSYRLDETPEELIDKYDVWEIELDFGIPFDAQDFMVGHGGPEPKHGLKSLGDWVRNLLSAKSWSDHPLLLKLEAKTHKPCSPFRFPSFQCADNWGDDWQARLHDSLLAWIGDEQWITRSKFERELDGVWPTVSELAGKIIVTLQDSNDDRDIDTTSGSFFGRAIPGLAAVWPPIKNEADFQAALESGASRLTMDDAYQKPWAVIP